MQHWPGFFTNAFSNDAYVEGLGRCVQQGLAKAVGVSNYRKDRIESASARLQVHAPPPPLFPPPGRVRAHTSGPARAGGGILFVALSPPICLYPVCMCTLGEGGGGGGTCTQDSRSKGKTNSGWGAGLCG